MATKLVAVRVNSLARSVVKQKRKGRDLAPGCREAVGGNCLSQQVTGGWQR